MGLSVRTTTVDIPIVPSGYAGTKTHETTIRFGRTEAKAITTYP
jgi:hypothetical protein